MERDLARDLRVGLFVLGALILGGLAMVLLAGDSEFFEERYRLGCRFVDVAGLREGAVVRLAGIDVGEVSRIRFPEEPGSREIRVELSVLRRFEDRIRADSVARIETEGLLGDKYVSISMGSAGQPMLADGDELQVQESISLLEYQKTATEVLNDLQGIARKVNLAMGGEADADRANLAVIVQRVERILQELEEGEGLLHTLIYDPALSRRVDRSLRNLEQASASVASAAAEIQSGSGLAHELIYGEQGARIAEQVQGVLERLDGIAVRLDGIVAEVESGDGLAHAVVYDEQQVRILADLQEAAADLRTLVDAIESGEGTLGLLATDPTLYEELRSLVGGAQRSRLLRAYVRRTVEEAEERDAASFDEPAASVAP